MALHESAHAPVDIIHRVPATRAEGGGLAALGIIAGLGAIAASSCCVIPLALASLGAGAGVFSMLEALIPWRVPLLVASGASVAAGWFIWSRKQSGCDAGSACATRRRSRTSFALLLIASLAVATAIGWNYLELPLLMLVR